MPIKILLKSKVFICGGSVVKKNVDTIIFDFNGTILDDVKLCNTILSDMLAERGCPRVALDRYLEIFTFPVQEYYIKAGFDFSKYTFDELAVEFINLYQPSSLSCSLYDGVVDTLKYYKDQGKRIVCLSASEINNLKEQLNHFHIAQYFDDILGIDNINAKGKLAIAKTFFAKENIDCAKTIMIGDTLHDAEVAIGLGIEPILVAKGHQSYQRLIQSGCKVLNDIREINEYIK